MMVNSFGKNTSGQLGLGHSKPSRVSNLPKIKQIACGVNFTFCAGEKDYFGHLEIMNSYNYVLLGDVRDKVIKKFHQTPFTNI